MGKAWTTHWAPPVWHTPTQGADEGKIKTAEGKLGVRLPARLRAMLSTQNGGPLRGRHRWSTQHHDIRGIEVGYFGIDNNQPWWLDDEHWQPAGPLTLLVPISGDGHEDLCLDYRTSGPVAEPRMTHVDCEMGRERTVAASFDEFLEQIEPTEVGLLVQDADISAHEVATRLGKVCRSEPRRASQSEEAWMIASGRGTFLVAENHLRPSGDWYRIPEQPVDGLALLLRNEDVLPAAFDKMRSDLYAVAQDAVLQ